MEFVRPAFGRLIYACAVALAIAGCSGNGCSCMAPIPGGFPDSERVPNSAQVRVTDTGVQQIESNPAALVGGLLGTSGGSGNVLEFPVPAQCGGTAVCCSGGMPDPNCPPIEIDLGEQAGDQPRLEVNPVQGQKQIDITLRARVSTSMDLPVSTSGINCLIHIDTTQSGSSSMQLDATATMSQDQTTGTTRIDVSGVTVSGIDNGDVDIKQGDFLCIFGGLAKGTVITQLTDTLSSTLTDTLNNQLCKQCTDVSECGQAADACTGGTCMIGSRCEQELGIVGRMKGDQALGSFSPGTTGGMDVYTVAGGYATSDQNGLALGLLGGFLPAGTDRDRCGPPADPPAAATIPQSTYFQGNTRPDTGGTFDVGIGIHQHTLDQAAWAAYDGGMLCLNVGTRTVDLLTSETLSVLMPSFIDLLHGNVAQMVLGLRPQSPPRIVLGPGTFTPDGKIDQPLLDVFFDGLQIDFYGQVDDQFIRLMTLTADVELPLNLDVDDMGALVPVLGNTDNAFTNIAVSNSDALAETPAELEAKVPALLSLALPLLTSGLGSFAIPQLAGLTLEVQPDGITSVDNNTFLAIFADLLVGAAAGPPPPRVTTTARIASLEVPPTEVFSAPTLDQTRRPRVELELGGTPGTPGAPLEWSVRVDGGPWTPYSRDDRMTLSRNIFWLQGRHKIEVRAREVGQPRTTDSSPVVLSPVIDTLPPVVSFDRGAGEVTVNTHDNVPDQELRVEYRWSDSGWRQATGSPAEVDAASHDPRNLEVRVTDEAGNVTTTSPAVIGFHGTSQGSSGCNCNTSGGPGGIMLLLLCLLGLSRRSRRALTRALRPALLVIVAGALGGPGCSCGGANTNVCSGEGGQCIDGEPDMGPVGRWDSIAVSPDRTVVAAYDQGNGDLVLVDVASDGTMTYQAVDGVPVEEPVYDPSTYRGGVVGAGPDVGAWTSVVLQNGLARIAYQDIDAGVLKFAAEQEDHTFVTHVVDADTGGGRLGAYASLAYDANGTPAIAYMAVGVDDGNGGKKNELRWARSTSPTPLAGTAWTVSVIDDSPVTCAGLCGDGNACIADAGSGAETCQAVTTDCTADCGSQVCISGTCTDAVPDPPAYDVPNGTGLFARAGFLPDGRAVVVYYDRADGDLKLQADETAWVETDLDASPDTDTGFAASMAIDDSGTVHVAYQDALADRLLYTSWADGTVGPVEVVDDGSRTGDRTHPVGSGAAILLVGGQPAIAYQDGATSDLLISQRAGDGTWSRGDLLVGANLDGFYVSAATSGSALGISSYSYDRGYYPPGDLVVITAIP